MDNTLFNVDKKKNIFVIKKGHTEGIFVNHDFYKDILPRIDGFEGAHIESFDNISEAKEFWGDQHIVIKNPVKVEPAPEESNEIPAVSTKRKREEEELVRIYTDGSCLDNGTPRARAGYGVYFGKDDERNISKKLPGVQTNNRAELTAIIKALEATKDSTGVVEIHSDSQYCSQGITSWINGWKRSGWKTANKKDVKNKDLWVHLDSLYNSKRKDRIKFCWIKGHSGNQGNEEADRLANLGARMKS